MELDNGTWERPQTLAEYITETSRRVLRDPVSRALDEAISLGHVTFAPAQPYPQGGVLVVADLYFEDQWAGEVYGPNPNEWMEGDFHFTGPLVEYLTG